MSVWACENRTLRYRNGFECASGYRLTVEAFMKQGVLILRAPLAIPAFGGLLSSTPRLLGQDHLIGKQYDIRR